MKFINPRLLKFSRSSRGFILLTVLTALATTAITIAQAFLLTNIIVSAFQERSSLEELRNTIIYLGLLLIVRSLLAYISERFTNQISHSIRGELRSALMEKVASHGTELNQKYGSGEIALLTTKGVSSLEPYFNKFLPQFFIALTVPVIVAITITSQDLLSGLVILFTIPLIPLFGALIGRYTASAMERKWRTLGILSGYVLDLLHGLTTLKVYGRSKLQRENLEKQSDRYRKETMQVLKVSFLSSFALELIATLSVALLAVEIGIRLVNGNMLLATGLVVLILAPDVYWPIRNVAAQFHASSDGFEASKKIFEIIDFHTESESAEEKLRGIGKFKELRWTDCEVKYNNQVSVGFRWGIASSGKLTVITGKSGSGKTTLVNAIVRAFPLASGRIFIESNRDTFRTDLLDNDYWIEQISWIPQNPHFATGTIEENFKLIKPRAKKEFLNDLLNQVNLTAEELPQGLKTEIDERQSGLSVGQLRRLAFARALLKDSPILLVDEPTASLDTENEKLINTALRDLSRKGKIVIAITHDLELIKMADRVINFEQVRVTA